MQAPGIKRKQMQNVAFKNINEFLEFLPPAEFKMVEMLRKTIVDCVPGIVEKLSYNVPFYSRNKSMFLIWPAAILWGNKKSYSGVRFGFQQGYLLNDELNYLDKGNRKQVYWKDFLTLYDIDIDILKTYIFEAVEIDNAFKNK